MSTTGRYPTEEDNIRPIAFSVPRPRTFTFPRSRHLAVLVVASHFAVSVVVFTRDEIGIVCAHVVGRQSSILFFHRWSSAPLSPQSTAAQVVRLVVSQSLPAISPRPVTTTAALLVLSTARRRPPPPPPSFSSPPCHFPVVDCSPIGREKRNAKERGDKVKAVFNKLPYTLEVSGRRAISSAVYFD